MNNHVTHFGGKLQSLRIGRRDAASSSAFLLRKPLSSRGKPINLSHRCPERRCALPPWCTCFWNVAQLSWEALKGRQCAWVKDAWLGYKSKSLWEKVISASESLPVRGWFCSIARAEEIWSQMAFYGGKWTSRDR